MPAGPVDFARSRGTLDTYSLRIHPMRRRLMTYSQKGLPTLRRYSWGDRLKLAFEVCLTGMGVVLLLAVLVATIRNGVEAALL